MGRACADLINLRLSKASREEALRRVREVERENGSCYRGNYNGKGDLCEVNAPAS